jgi:predicted kinase
MIPYFVMMCGIVGAGKSYWAEEISKMERLDNPVICSSDAIREELFGDINCQDNNEEVFKVLHSRVKDNLRNGKSVIYDACNINSKRRRAFLAELKNIPCAKGCVVIETPFAECCKRNEERDRVVPKNVIERMYKNWQTPYWFEGWDGIFELNTKKGVRNNVDRWVESNMGFEQHNSHHTMTLGEHCLAVANELKEDPLLYYAGLVHDCGKPFTKSFVDSKGEISSEAHYYNHNYVGSYDSLFFRYPDGVQSLDVSILVGLHMMPYFWEKDEVNGEKTKEKYRKLWGDELFNDVMKLHEADKRNH